MLSHRKAPLSRKALWASLGHYPEPPQSPFLAQIQALLPDYASQATLQGISILSPRRLDKARIAEVATRFPGVSITWTNDWRVLLAFSLDNVS